MLLINTIQGGNLVSNIYPMKKFYNLKRSLCRAVEQTYCGEQPINVHLLLLSISPYTGHGLHHNKTIKVRSKWYYFWVINKCSPTCFFLDFFKPQYLLGPPGLLVFVNCCVTHFYQNPIFWVEKVFTIPPLHLGSHLVCFDKNVEFEFAVSTLRCAEASVFFSFAIVIFCSCFWVLENDSSVVNEIFLTPFTYA